MSQLKEGVVCDISAQSALPTSFQPSFSRRTDSVQYSVIDNVDKAYQMVHIVCRDKAGFAAVGFDQWQLSVIVFIPLFSSPSKRR